MNQVGSIVGEILRTAEAEGVEREQTIRAAVGDQGLLAWVADTHGDDFADLFPDDLTVEEYAATVNETGVDEAKKRLRLCSTCPEYGGGCASEYETDRGKAPCWDREKGLRLEWCRRWPEHIVRKKLTSVGVGSRLLGCRFDTYNPANGKQTRAKLKCEAYAKEFKRGSTKRNLLLAGSNFGIGKTHLSVSVVADLLARYRIRTAMFVYVPEFLERIRRSYSREEPDGERLIEKASNTDLLVLDDLLAHRTTEWVQEQMNLISNARWSNGRPTIITTNEGPDEMTTTIGPRAASRLLGDALAVHVDGEDHRWQK
jgi:DNA replication protein DnaC